MPDAADELSRTPVPDPAEDNAYFPSPYSLSQYVPSKTDFTGVQYENAYTGGRWKILMIATEERYMLMQNDTMFSTGNHPVEMLLPLHHLKAAGFGIDVATVSGNPAKLELWAMPREDQAVLDTYAELSAKLKKPQKLSHVIADALGPDSDYLAVFIPGGHGVLLGIPDSEEVRTGRSNMTSTSSPSVTVPAHCSPPVWTGTNPPSADTACACSPMRWTPA
ncbi:molecular chaperone Hsp31 and glyoxalase 3 [Mycobacteroides abscessus subsp. bolletii]|nr:molecular chaperone Hsp31 and glyoxalase 3 [Mycobacteroides abscessus subsp. bolletii]